MQNGSDLRSDAVVGQRFRPKPSADAELRASVLRVNFRSESAVAAVMVDSERRRWEQKRGSTRRDYAASRE